MKRFLRTVLVAWCLTFGLVVLAPPQASAGIIVTEGKINQCGVEVESIRAMMILGLWPEDVECPDEASSPSDESEGSGESSDDHGYEGDDLDLDEEDLGDMDATPDGYTCTDVGGGVELCEPSDESDESDESDSESSGDAEGGQGAGAGSAQGGVWYDVHTAATSTEDHSASHDSVSSGCQAGGGQPLQGLPTALLVLLALVAVIRRRGA